MFGELFNEGGGDGFSSVPPTNPPPPAPRGRTRLAGIWNQGATCFLNGPLQCLCHQPEIRAAIFRLGKLELGWDKEGKEKSIPIQMQRMFASLMLEDQQAVSSEAVTTSFGWTAEQVRDQHDAQELFTELFRALEESLSGTSGANIIRDLMHITTVQKIQCGGCGNTTEKEHEDRSLFAHVEGFPKGLEQSLHHSFNVPEQMAGADQYKCDQCQAKRDAQKIIKIRRLTTLLMISLNRFSYTADYRPYKVKERFPFPLELDMSRFTEHCAPHPDLLYELSAVIVHSGNYGGGHYMAYIRDIDDIGHWEMADDAVGEDPLSQGSVIMDSVGDCVSAKQVVATVLAHTLMQRNGHAVSIDKLSAEIGQQTGVPWSKRFKGTHGSFPKFLTSNKDLFSVNGNLVSLTERPGNDGQREPSNGNADGDTTTAAGPSSSPQSMSDKPRGPQHVPQPGKNWFLFNDGNVIPVLEKALEKEFGGNACAYMLLYRQKNAPRPAEAKGNPAYNIPAHVLDEIKQKNEDLAKQWEKYEQERRVREEEEERKRQQVQVDLRYHFNYTFEAGMLKTDCNSVTETFQRTTTLGELMVFMGMFASGRLDDDKFRVHRMKCWDDKTHLYDELCDKEKTLEELSIENGTILFAWDGYQVDGQPVPTGAGSEPLTLQLKEFLAPRVLAHAFPRSLPLKLFQAQVSALTGIPQDRLKLQLPHVWLGQDPERPAEEEEQQPPATLESLRLKDRDCILFDGGSHTSFGANLAGQNSLSGAEPRNTGERFCIYIENRCDKTSMESPLLELEVEKNMTVGEVKRLCMATYSIGCDCAALQEKHIHHGMQPPYDEGMTVALAGITATTQLVLDWTKMQRQFKLFPDPDSSLEAMSVLVDKQCTVEECLKAMVQVAGIEDPSEWHVCTASFLYDRIHVLDDWDLKLDTSCHYLVLERGRLPPKDHIALPVWLHPTPKSLCRPDDADATVLEIIENIPSEPCLLDNVEIWKGARLEDLRSQIAELLAAKKDIKVKPSQLRLRMMEGINRRLRRVLRDPNNTLRQLRLDKTPIAVQIVSHTATPCKEEIIVSVGVMKADEGAYDTAQELVWDTRLGTSAARLKEHIAAGMLIPEQMFVIAKHIPKDFRWAKLEDSAKTSTAHDFRKRPGKKQSRAAARGNTHRPTFRLEDGDFIGVVRLAFGAPLDEVKADDFCSVQDLVGRQQLQEEGDKKRMERQQHPPNGFLPPVYRGPQKDLKIKVENNIS